jgi:hypothetical protein
MYLKQNPFRLFSIKAFSFRNACMINRYQPMSQHDAETPEPSFELSFEAKLAPDKRDAFFKLVQERYNGDLQAALERAIDYFLMYERATGARHVADTLKQIQDKISTIREMNSQITDTLRDINAKTAQLNQNRQQKKNE